MNVLTTDYFSGCSALALKSIRRKPRIVEKKITQPLNGYLREAFHPFTFTELECVPVPS
tara:strand:+ start:2564 stop:2740 length:177 start_codon:yes stop_codon:yes gene_type:complete